MTKDRAIGGAGQVRDGVRVLGCAVKAEPQRLGETGHRVPAAWYLRRHDQAAQVRVV